MKNRGIWLCLQHSFDSAKPVAISGSLVLILIKKRVSPLKWMCLRNYYRRRSMAVTGYSSSVSLSPCSLYFVNVLRISELNIVIWMDKPKIEPLKSIVFRKVIAYQSS